MKCQSGLSVTIFGSLGYGRRRPVIIFIVAMRNAILSIGETMVLKFSGRDSGKMLRVMIWCAIASALVGRS